MSSPLIVPRVTRSLAPEPATGAGMNRSPARLAGRTIGGLALHLTLVKPRIVSLVVFTAVVACFVAAHGRPAGATVLLLILSGALSAGGASAFNHYFDRDIDALMGRTRRRPLVVDQGRRARRILAASLALTVAGIALATIVNLTLAGFELSGAFVYAGIYTVWLKRRSPLNIVIGGFAGSAAVLGGWAAVTPGLGLVPVLLAALVFLWTPAHFWSLALARGIDYEQAQVPMLPIIVGPRVASWLVTGHILPTIALSILTGVVASFGPVYFATAAGAGIVFLRHGWQLLRDPGPSSGWQTFKFSGPYLGLIFLGVFVDALTRASAT